jgi:hypothetical protein|tara:strand:- start:162 stop:542 length:381 start_codon:yes stop_codon:yes gene_type:complete
VALPAIIDYKVTEACCEKLPKLLPLLFPEVPEAEQLRQYAVLHQKHKQPLFDIFMELGGAPDGSCPRASRLRGAPRARLWFSLCCRCCCCGAHKRRLLLQERTEDRLQHWRRGAKGVLRPLPALPE